MRARVAPRARSRRRCADARASRDSNEFAATDRPNVRLSECPNAPIAQYGAQCEFIQISRVENPSDAAGLFARARRRPTVDARRARHTAPRHVYDLRVLHRRATDRGRAPPREQDAREAFRRRARRQGARTRERATNARDADARASNRGGRDRSCYPRRRRRRARRERGEEGRERAWEFRCVARARRGARAGVDGGTAGGTRRRRSRGAYPRGVWSARARRGRILRSTRRGWRRV